MTLEQLNEIKARCEAATEGSWYTIQGEFQFWPQYIATASSNYEQEPMRPDGANNKICHFHRDRLSTALANCGPSLVTHKEETANAELLAHARKDLPDCLDEIERLQQELSLEKANA